MIFQYVLETFQILATPINAITMIASVALGLIIGMLPGLTATMGIALLTGLTYRIAPETAIISLIGIYVGAISGGCQSAILINIPGTPASAATALDGHPMARKGEGGFAIFLATTASAIGTLFSVLCLLLLTPPLTSLALDFGSWEFFLLALFGVMICGQLTGEAEPLKGWISGILGLLIAMVGLDGLNSYPRFSYGNVNLMSGIDLIPIMIGVFGFPEVVNAFKEGNSELLKLTSFKIAEGFRCMKKYIVTIIRSSIIGVVVGIIPGVGEGIASWLSYWGAKSSSKEKDDFGKGAPEGIIASETGNNACIGGAIIPLLSLAIPGSAPAAVLLAALWLHGLKPGPLMMTQNPEFLYRISIYIAVAAIVMWGSALIIAKATVKILKLKSQLLMPMIYVLSMVGAFVINNKITDVYMMFMFGIIGLVFVIFKLPSASFLLGIILGPLADTSLRRALILENGSIVPFFTRPISLIFVIGILIMVLSQLSIFNKALKIAKLKLMPSKS